MSAGARQRSWWWAARYVLALALVAGATALRWSLSGVLEGTAYLIYYPAVVAAAAVGGLGPGAVAAITATLAYDILFTPPFGRLSPEPLEWARHAIFLAGGLGISLLAGQLRRSLRELRQSEGRMRATFDNAGVGIVEVADDDHFIAVNDRACQVLGYSRQEFLRLNVHDLTWPEDQPLSDDINAQLRDGRASRLEYEKRYRKRDGTPLWVHVTVSAVRDAGGRWLRGIATVEDISERKAAEAQLRLQAEALEAASKAKDHFLAVLSHELRTPLTPVLACVSMLQDDPSLASLGPDVRESLEMVRRNAELEARLIDDLLDVTRIARGKVELHKRPVELCQVVRRAVEVCKPDIEARQLHFGVAVEEGGPWLVEADAARLQQVFWNLLKNAVKFTPVGGCVGIRCRGEVARAESTGNRQQATGNSVIVEVSDSGVGIEPEALPHIFKAFEQGERSITRQFGGLGLGLTISKAMVEMHGGTIAAYSEGRNKGATFIVKLPLESGSALRVPGPGTETPGTRSPEPGTRSLRILLVEDHGDTARIMRRLLASEGHQVQIAGDVATALNLAASHDFDLLLSDLGLPDASGLDLMRELRRRGDNTPGIALSGYGQEQDIQRSREAGFATHLTKPTSVESLAEAIARVGGGREGAGGAPGGGAVDEPALRTLRLPL